MAKVTQQQALIKALELNGWAVDAKRSTKHRTQLTHPGAERRWFVGKAGSLRYGHNVANSFSSALTQRGQCLHAALLEVGGYDAR